MSPHRPPANALPGGSSADMLVPAASASTAGRSVLEPPSTYTQTEESAADTQVGTVMAI